MSIKNFTDVSTMKYEFKNQRPFASCGTLSDLTNCHEGSLPICKDQLYNSWFLTDAVDKAIPAKSCKLPMASFNHIAREVLCLEKSKRFYVDILGFDVIPRPPFDSEGYWLNGYGLNLHLVATTTPEQRKKLKATRIKHFSSALPRVDHIAFLTDDLAVIRETLDHEKVYYKTDSPAGNIRQIFFFDPDGNVIEISNCAPRIGETNCTVSTGDTANTDADAVSAVHFDAGESVGYDLSDMDTFALAGFIGEDLSSKYDSHNRTVSEDTTMSELSEDVLGHSFSECDLASGKPPLR